MPKNPSIHQGHRQRLKERFCREGLDNFNEVNVLELMLFYCVQRVDTNPLAHRLLDHYGSLSRVLEAPREELMSIEGVSENVAIYLNLVKDIGRYYMVSGSKTPDVMKTLDDCAKQIRPHFIGRSKEMVFLLCLDAQCGVICCRMISEGGVNSAPLTPRMVVENAINTRAASVVLAHNHPSGVAVPSKEDVTMTKRIADALESVDVILVDHVIFGNDDDYVSMVQSNYYAPQLSSGSKPGGDAHEDRRVPGQSGWNVI